MLFCKNKERLQLIDEIIADLKTLRTSGFENQYAVDENIKFFEALKSRWAYIKWLIKDRPQIDGSRLLELSDFHLANGKWERILQDELLVLEQKKFPDVQGIIRKAIIKAINKLWAQAKKPLILVSLGSGALEIERQLIWSLRKQKSDARIILFCIDNARESIEAGKKNIANSNIQIDELNDIKPEMIRSYFTGGNQSQYRVIIIHGDALMLDRYFGPRSIDIVYHSRFKHHLAASQKEELDRQIMKTAKIGLEHDDLNGWFLLIFTFISNWQKPVLMNGGVFSCLRDPKKIQLKITTPPEWKLKFFLDGYFKIYQYSNG